MAVIILNKNYSKYIPKIIGYFFFSKQKIRHYAPTKIFKNLRSSFVFTQMNAAVALVGKTKLS